MVLILPHTGVWNVLEAHPPNLINIKVLEIISSKDRIYFSDDPYKAVSGLLRTNCMVRGACADSYSLRVDFTAQDGKWRYFGGPPKIYN